LVLEALGIASSVKTEHFEPAIKSVVVPLAFSPNM
jgi:hypothetical protein